LQYLPRSKAEAGLLLLFNEIDRSLQAFEVEENEEGDADEEEEDVAREAEAEDGDIEEEVNDGTKNKAFRKRDPRFIFFSEGLAPGVADNTRRKRVKKGGAHEAENDRLETNLGGAGFKNINNVFDGGEAERDGDEVDHGVDGFVKGFYGIEKKEDDQEF